MKSEYLPKEKLGIGYILNSHSTLLEDQSFHPAFKLTEKIYSTEKSNFFESLNSPNKAPRSLSPVKPTSQTPIPMRYYRDNKSGKEDIFLNPSAYYLSKKPIAFSKFSRERQRKKNNSMVAHTISPQHKKAQSHDLRAGKPKLPMVSPFVLTPIEDIKGASPLSTTTKGNNSKDAHCEVLTQIESYCENLRAQPPIKLEKEKKILNKYSEKMNWITDVLQSYGEYDYRILKELFKYSNDSRNDLESERANIVHLMKIGVFDPNKNVIKLRARLKKKKERIT